MSESTWLGFVVQKAPQGGFSLKQCLMTEDGQMVTEDVMYRSSLAEINQYRLVFEQQFFRESSWFAAAMQPQLPLAPRPEPPPAAPPPHPEEPLDMPPGIVPEFRHNGMSESDQGLVGRMATAAGQFMGAKNGRTANSFVVLAFCTAVAMSAGLRSFVT